MDLSSDFPVLKKYTYLNTAYSGLLPVSSAAWRAGHDKEFVEEGSNFKEKNKDIIFKLRNNISNLFGVKKENVFLVPNFSIGFNTLLNGLNKKHRFLLLKEDYPSIISPVTGMGFEYYEVVMDEKMEDRIINAIENFKPTIFAFSMVQYISGLKMNEAFLKKIKKDFPDLLFVADGTQFTGTTAFSFSTSGLDALLGSGYKWLLGGYGNGYVFLSDQMKESLYQVRKSKIVAGHASDDSNYLSLCFEPGHLDSLNFGSLSHGLDYLQSLGMDFIEKMNQQLCRTAINVFYKMGLIPDWMFNRNEQSTIINLPLESTTIDKLNASKILSSRRGAGLRISFHFYNTEEDLNHFLDVIRQK